MRRRRGAQGEGAKCLVWQIGEHGYDGLHHYTTSAVMFMERDQSSECAPAWQRLVTTVGIYELRKLRKVNRAAEVTAVTTVTCGRCDSFRKVVDVTDATPGDGFTHGAKRMRKCHQLTMPPPRQRQFWPNDGSSELRLAQTTGLTCLPALNLQSGYEANGRSLPPLLLLMENPE